MTPEGYQDYRRALAEIYVQRSDRASRYNNVWRIHCTDGYVDVTYTRSTKYPPPILAAAYGIDPEDVNGMESGQSVETVLAWIKSQGIATYDVWRRGRGV